MTRSLTQHYIHQIHHQISSRVTCIKEIISGNFRLRASKRWRSRPANVVNVIAVDAGLQAKKSLEIPCVHGKQCVFSERVSSKLYPASLHLSIC
jgi:hypothetical protein